MAAFGWVLVVVIGLWTLGTWRAYRTIPATQRGSYLNINLGFIVVLAVMALCALS